MTNTTTTHTPINLHPGIVLMVPADLADDPSTKTLVAQCKAVIDSAAKPATSRPETPREPEADDLETMRKWNDLGLTLFRAGGIALSLALEHAEAATTGIKFVTRENEDRIAAFYTNTVKEIARRGVYLQSLGREATEKTPDNSDAEAINTVWWAIVTDDQKAAGNGWWGPDSLMGRYGQPEEEHAADLAEGAAEIVKGADRYIRTRLMGLDHERDLERVLRIVDSVQSGDLSILDEDYAPFLNCEDEEHDYKGHMDRAAVCLARKDGIGCVSNFFEAHGCAAKIGDLDLDYRIGLIAWLCYRGMEPMPAASEGAA